MRVRSVAQWADRLFTSATRRAVAPAPGRRSAPEIAGTPLPEPADRWGPRTPEDANPAAAAAVVDPSTHDRADADPGTASIDPVPHDGILAPRRRARPASSPFAPGADRATGLIPDHGTRYLPRGLWLAVYCLAIVGPLALILVRDTADPRPFLFELGSALGIAALSLLAMQLVLPARMPLLASLGAEVAVRLHRRLADIMLAMVVAHVVAVMVADPSRLKLLEFVGEPWRAQAAMTSLAALLILFATSFARRRIRLSYVAWRVVHVVLGGLALVLAVVHTIGVGRYLVSGPAGWTLVGLTVAGLGAIAIMRSRFVRAGSLRPYVVERVVEERGGAITLELAADGHLGQRFIPGQFAWLRAPRLLTSLAEHPFSYSSSAESPGHPSFTMKVMAGFSARAAEFAPGTRLLVDGPHGAFRPRAASTGALLIAGGIGITPSMSILRTAADRGDRRPYMLIYAARTAEAVTFAEDLEALTALLDLTVVVVLSSPPPDWTGERGRIDAGVLDRHLPADLRGWQFMVCGSGPFVDTAMLALEGVGVPGERVHAERFVEV